MIQRHRPFSAIAILLLTIPFAFIATGAARLGAPTPCSSSFSTQPQRKLPPGDDGPPKPPGIPSDETGELENPPESGGSTNPPPMSVHTEVQCNWWQRIAVDNDEDSSGGLDREEYFAFLNVISLDHFEGDDEDEGSWQDVFYKLAQPEPVDGDTILQVSIKGFSSNSVDPKTEKEHGKIREKFCKSVFDGLIDEGVDESAMDLAIFMDGLFEDPTTKPKPKPPKPDSETEMETTTSTSSSSTSSAAAKTEASSTTTVTTTEATFATTTPIPTTSSHTSKSTTTTTSISSSTATTRSPTTTTSETTTTTAATTTSNPATTEITTIPSPETTTSSPTTTETTATITTSASTSAVKVDENSQESATSPELKNTTPATTIEATDAATTPVQITTVASSTSSSFNTTATTNATTTMTTLTTTSSTPPQGGLPSELDKVIKVSAAVEQAMVRSDELDESNDDSRSSRPSTGVIVGVVGGLAAMVVLIVAMVTRHPFFDPGRRERNNQCDD